MILLLSAACERTPGAAARGRSSTTDPALLDVVIEPADPRSGYDDLRCSTDAVAPVFRWTVDGIEVAGVDDPRPGDTVPAERTRLGHTWRCEVTAGARRGSAEVTPRAGGNLLVLLVDDIGREKLAAEGIATGGDLPQTPVLDGVAEQSVRFVNAWATPLCTPTRATILTGRMPRQHGVGNILYPADRYPLPDEEVFLPQVLAQAPDPVTSRMVGKWHLNVRDVGSAEDQPGLAGFTSWRGSNGNLASHFVQAPGRFGYLNWEYNVDGELSVQTEYATEVVVRDAVEALGTLEPPWLLYVALNAAHDPFHVPPPGWTYSTPPAEAPTLREQAALMIESADIAVGRVLAALTEEQRLDTTIVFLSDNGSMFSVAGPPFDLMTSKGTAYEGGVNVPFWVSGPLVRAPGTTSEALVQTSDLFDTALALAGVLPTEADALVGAADRTRYSESLLPYLADPDRPSVREVAYTEKLSRNGPPPWAIHTLAIRDSRWKIVRQVQESVIEDELYDLVADRFERSDLLEHALDEEQGAAFDLLSARLESLEQDLVFDY
jgi:arylsulfatase B